MHLLVMLAFNLFCVAFPIFVVASLDWSLTETGTFFAVMGLLMVLVQGPLYGRLSGRVSDTWLVVDGSVVLAVDFWLYSAGTTIAIYGAVVCLALGNGVMWPTLQSVLSRVAGDQRQGAAQGVAGSLGAVASIVGLVAGGLLGPRVFWLATAITLVVAGLSAWLCRAESDQCLHRLKRNDA